MRNESSTTSWQISEAIQLGHPRLHVGALAGVLLAGRRQHQQARRLDLGGHLGQLELDRPGAGRSGGRTPPAPARSGWRSRTPAGRRRRRGRRRSRGPPRCPTSSAGSRAPPRRPAGWPPARGGRRTPAPSSRRPCSRAFELRRDRQAALRGRAGLLLDEQAAHAAVARVGGRVGLHEHRHHARAKAVGDPHLLAVDHVVVAVADGRRRIAWTSEPHSGSVIEKAQRSSPVAIRGRKRCLLLLRAVAHQHVGDDEVGVDDPRDRHPARGPARSTASA